MHTATPCLHLPYVRVYKGSIYMYVHACICVRRRLVCTCHMCVYRSICILGVCKHVYVYVYAHICTHQQCVRNIICAYYTHTQTHSHPSTHSNIELLNTIYIYIYIYICMYTYTHAILYLSVNTALCFVTSPSSVCTKTS